MQSITLTNMKPEHVEYIPYIYAKMTAYLDLKIFLGLVWSALVYLFDRGQAEAMIALFLLTLVDWIFGVAASKKSGERITSAKFFRTPIKLAVYFALIACSRISEYALPGAIAFLDETMVAGLVITELLSVFEKSGKMGFIIPKRLLNQLEELRDGEDKTLSVKK
jgi:phage-related holin